ncbi:tissue-type plasminogen activator-like isoform X2 [Myxocyprinus asiaticus]|uniref:tissue-type plasminogen activator-like isoform X2 n=1 Tax=Myxocyprinus asiaticus TaxID=70543 RepID=UPI0022236519|nr:tissue-type plasminogen activator-like isoform X2 [Myxocyprinus asiaticus]
MMCTFRILLLTCALCCIEAIYRPWDKRFGKFPAFPAVGKLEECIPDGSDGSSYKGNVSVTVNGRLCVSWHLVKRQPIPSLRHHQHNYCRNPNKRIMPWCVVKKRNRFVQEYCDIPRCKTKPKLTCGERSLVPRSKIIGGVRSTVESHPWIAAIFYGEKFTCGGSLIAPCWVLTAAHCFTSGMNTKTNKYSVYLGRNAINESNPIKEQQFTVSKLVVHEGFNYKTQNFTHDIALLKIVGRNGKCASKTSSVRTVCLPPSRVMLPPGTYCEILGYGRHEKDGFEYSKHLKQAQVKLISQRDCVNYYNKQEDNVNEHMFCGAGESWKEDACQGDSGGPLLCEVNNIMFQFGIISWGDKCAEEFKPGVYTKVTNFNQWISEHTGLPSYTAGSRYPQKD